jgi:hypothetical protein
MADNFIYVVATLKPAEGKTEEVSVPADAPLQENI